MFVDQLLTYFWPAPVPVPLLSTNKIGRPNFILNKHHTHHFVNIMSRCGPSLPRLTCASSTLTTAATEISCLRP
jgi:hypothetical protein